MSNLQLSIAPVISKLITQTYSPGPATLQRYQVNYGAGTGTLTLNAKEIAGVTTVECINAGAQTFINFDTAPNYFNYNILDPIGNNIGDLITFQVTNTSGFAIVPSVVAPTGISFTGVLGNGLTGALNLGGTGGFQNNSSYLIGILKTATGPIAATMRATQI